MGNRRTEEVAGVLSVACGQVAPRNNDLQNGDCGSKGTRPPNIALARLGTDSPITRRGSDFHTSCVATLGLHVVTRTHNTFRMQMVDLAPDSFARRALVAARRVFVCMAGVERGSLPEFRSATG